MVELEAGLTQAVHKYLDVAERQPRTFFDFEGEEAAKHCGRSQGYSTGRVPA